MYSLNISLCSCIRNRQQQCWWWCMQQLWHHLRVLYDRPIFFRCSVKFVSHFVVLLHIWAFETSWIHKAGSNSTMCSSLHFFFHNYIKGLIILIYVIRISFTPICMIMNKKPFKKKFHIIFNTSGIIYPFYCMGSNMKYIQYLKG